VRGTGNSAQQTKGHKQMTYTKGLTAYSDNELQAELDERQLTRDQREWLVYTGELECTDAEDVITMTDLQ
jgi:hypothetical protein